MPMDDATALLMQIQSKPIPRRVRFRFSVMLSPVVLFTIVVIGLLFWVLHASAFRTAASFFGQEADAFVYDSKTWVTHGKGGSQTHYGLYIEYPYPGNTYNAFAPVTYNLYQTTKSGDIIKVRYIKLLHGYPYINYDGDRFAFIPIGIFAFIVLMLWLFEMYTTYDLLKQGSPVAGTIISTRTGNKGAIFWMVSYKYKNEDVRKEFSGEKDNPHQVLVLVDQNNSKRARLYGSKYLWKLTDDIF